MQCIRRKEKLIPRRKSDATPLASFVVKGLSHEGDPTRVCGARLPCPAKLVFFPFLSLAPNSTCAKPVMQKQNNTG